MNRNKMIDYYELRAEQCLANIRLFVNRGEKTAAKEEMRIYNEIRRKLAELED